MRSLPVALIACLAALAVGSSCILNRTAGFEPDGTGASGAGGGGTGGIIMMGCDQPSDCGATTDCTTAVDCVNGSCVPSYAPPGTSCVVDGDPDKQYCNGTGSCVQCALAEHCEPGTCIGGVQTAGEECLGGLCNEVMGTLDCGDYTCNAAGTNCLSGCASTDECSQAGHVCDPGIGLGECAEPRLVGQPCSVDEACDSGFCADGVCCQEECATQCEACSMALTGAADGTCANILIGVDDQDESCPFGFGCQGDGTCTMCGDPTTALDTNVCPAVCDGGCGGGNDQCNIDCDAAGDCQGVINCPPGKDCHVDCSVAGACPAITVACPPGRDCKLTCANNMGSCAGSTLNCNDGPCEIDCKNGSGGNCTGTTINCGLNDCDVKCSATGEPIITDLQMSCSLLTDNEC